MDATQMYIIKQSCLNRATDLYSKTDSWSEEQILETADIFVSWVTGKESVNVKQSLPKKPEDQKTWLNFNTPDYNQALSWIIWSTLGYVLLFLIYRKVRKIELRFFRDKII